MNILLLEDDEMTLESIAYHLRQKGYKVFPASDGNKAIDIVLDNPIDLIICDLMVPLLSGVSFLSSRKKFMSLDIPVIAISSLYNAESMLNNLLIDVEVFVSKPIQFEKLLHLVNKCQLMQK